MATGNSPEWLNANSTRAYPLAENSSRVDVSGNVKLPDSLIVAAQINAGREYAEGLFFVSFVSAFPDVVSIGISYQDPSGAVRLVAPVSIPVALHSENKNYSFTGQGEDDSIIGSLSVGDLYETANTIPGQVDFLTSATPFEVNVLFLSVPALKSIELYSGNSLVKRFSRVMKLRQGENIRLSYVGDDTIRIDAINGENLVAEDDCENALPKPPCIRTINGISADSEGNFQIEGSACIDVAPADAGLSITDLCSKSCCGCEELSELVAGLQLVETQILALRSQVASTNEQQTQMIANLVANLS